MSTLKTTNLQESNASSANIVLGTGAGGGATISGVTTTTTLQVADDIIHTGDTNTKIRFPSADVISFENSGTETARTSATNQFSVGTTADVTGASVSIGASMRLVNANGSTATITAMPSGTYNTGVSGGSAIAFHRISEGGGGSDEIAFETHYQGNSHAESLRIEKAGDIKVNRGDLYFGTAGKGIVLGATSNTDANTLDDYEEGSWSPLWSNATTGGTTCSNQMHGRYTKIGRQVIAHFYTWGLPTVGNSDAMILQGFPFASAEMSEYWGGVQAGYFNMGDDSYYNLGIALHGSSVSYGYLQFSRESSSDVAAATFNGIINGYTNFSGTISYWTS